MTIFSFNRSFSTTGYKFLPRDGQTPLSLGESSRPVSNNDSQGNNSRVMGPEVVDNNYHESDSNQDNSNHSVPVNNNNSNSSSSSVQDVRDSDFPGYDVRGNVPPLSRGSSVDTVSDSNTDSSVDHADMSTEDLFERHRALTGINRPENRERFLYGLSREDAAGLSFI